MSNDPVEIWITQERDRVQRDLDKLEDRRAALLKELEALDGTLAIRQRSRKTITNRRPRPGIGFPTSDLTGMTVEDAAVRIAERNGGVLLSGVAREAMAEAGVIASDKQAGTRRLYHVMSTSERFESTGRRGEYRLIAEDEVADTSEADLYPFSARPLAAVN